MYTISHFEPLKLKNNIKAKSTLNSYLLLTGYLSTKSHEDGLMILTEPPMYAIDCEMVCEHWAHYLNHNIIRIIIIMGLAGNILWTSCSHMQNPTFLTQQSLLWAIKAKVKVVSSFPLLSPISWLVTAYPKQSSMENPFADFNGWGRWIHSNICIS